MHYKCADQTTLECLQECQKRCIQRIFARAYSIRSEEYLSEEINFLKDVFIENGYNNNDIETIINSYVPPKERHTDSNEQPIDAPFSTVSLPWIPGISQKLKKAFKQSNIKTTFKSGPNLRDILCKRNKSTIPKFSAPGIYMVPCSCNKKYVGETGANIKTRINQHQKAVFECRLNDSALASRT